MPNVNIPEAFQRAHTGAVPGSYRQPATKSHPLYGDLRCPSCHLLKGALEYSRLMDPDSDFITASVGNDDLCDDCNTELIALTEELG